MPILGWLRPILLFSLDQRRTKFHYKIYYDYKVHKSWTNIVMASCILLMISQRYSWEEKALKGKDDIPCFKKVIFYIKMITLPLISILLENAKDVLDKKNLWHFKYISEPCNINVKQDAGLKCSPWKRLILNKLD